VEGAERVIGQPDQCRVDDLTARAAQIRALPPAVQNREATLLVRCPRRALLVRVFRHARGELLALPAPSDRLLGSSWFVVPEADGLWQVSARCRCCPGMWQVSAEQLHAAIQAGKRTVTLCAVD
jgi:hypothetical protein